MPNENDFEVVPVGTKEELESIAEYVIDNISTSFDDSSQIGSEIKYVLRRIELLIAKAWRKT